MPVIMTLRPLDGTPMNGARWVAVIVQRRATSSPSAKRRSIEKRVSPNASIRAATSSLMPSRPGGKPGIAHVLDQSLKEIRRITLGECPSGAAVVQIPPE